MYIDLETGVRVSEADMQNYADQEGLDIEEYISLMGFTLESDNNTSESADTSSADLLDPTTFQKDAAADADVVSQPMIASQAENVTLEDTELELVDTSLDSLDPLDDYYVTVEDLRQDEEDASPSLNKKLAGIGISTTQGTSFGSLDALNFENSVDDEMELGGVATRFVGDLIGKPTKIFSAIGIGSNKTDEELAAAAAEINEYIKLKADTNFLDKAKKRSGDAYEKYEETLKAPELTEEELQSSMKKDLVSKFSEIQRSELSNITEGPKNEIVGVKQTDATVDQFENKKEFQAYNQWKKDGYIPDFSENETLFYDSERKQKYALDASLRYASDLSVEGRMDVLALAANDEKRLNNFQEISNNYFKTEESLKNAIKEYKLNPTQDNYRVATAIEVDYLQKQGDIQSLQGKLKKDGVFEKSKTVPLALMDFNKDYNRIKQLRTSFKSTIGSVTYAGAALATLAGQVNNPGAIAVALSGPESTSAKIENVTGLVSLGEDLQKETENFQRAIAVDEINSVSDAGKWVAGSSVNLIPSLAMAMTGPAAMPLFFLSGSGSKGMEMAVSRKNSSERMIKNKQFLIDNPDADSFTVMSLEKEMAEDAKILGISEWQSLGIQALYGIAEVAMEKVGTMTLLKNLKNGTKMLSPTTVKEGFKFLGNGLKEVGKGIRVEGGSEFGTTVAQNFGDIFILGEDKNLFEGGLESFAQGALMGGAMNSVGVAKGLRQGYISVLASKKESAKLKENLNALRKLTNQPEIQSWLDLKNLNLKLPKETQSVVDAITLDMQKTEEGVMFKLGSTLSIDQAYKVEEVNRKMRLLNKQLIEASTNPSIKAAELTQIESQLRTQFEGLAKEREQLLSDSVDIKQTKESFVDQNVSLDSTLGYSFYTQSMLNESVKSVIGNYSNLSPEANQAGLDAAKKALIKEGSKNPSVKEIKDKALEEYIDNTYKKKIESGRSNAEAFAKQQGLDLEIMSFEGKDADTEIIKAFEDAGVEGTELAKLKKAVKNGTFEGGEISGTNKIIINLNAAVKNKRIGIFAHEVLHKYAKEKYGSNQDAIDKAGADLLSYLEKNDKDLFAKVKFRIDQSYTEKDAEGNVIKDADYFEEAMNAMSDVLADGQVVNDKSMNKIRVFANSFLSKLPGKFQFTVDQGRDAYEFVKGYNKEAHFGGVKTPDNPIVSSTDDDEKAITKEDKDKKVSLSVSKAPLLDKINSLVPPSITTQEEYFSPKIFNEVFKATEEGGAISNYIKSKASSKEAGIKTIKSIQERLTNYDPAAERKKAGNKEPITFGEFIFSNTPFAIRDAKKALFKESEAAKKKADLDSKEVQSKTTEEDSGPTADTRKKYKSLISNPKLIPSFVLTEIKTKLADVVSKLTSKLSTRPKGKNKQTTPLIEEIKKAIGKVVGDATALPKQIINRMGNPKDGSYQKFLIDNKKSILENMTTTYLMTAIPAAVEKSVGGAYILDKNGKRKKDSNNNDIFDPKFVPYPEWVGKEIDREKVSTNKKGGTSGNQIVRRAIQVEVDGKFEDSITDKDFVANFVGSDGKVIRGKRESLGKAIAEEAGFEVLTKELANENSDIRKAFKGNQEALGVVLADNFVQQLSRDAERGTVKFSKTLNNLERVNFFVEEINTSRFKQTLSATKDLNKAIKIHFKDDFTRPELRNIAKEVAKNNLVKNFEFQIEKVGIEKATDMVVDFAGEVLFTPSEYKTIMAKYGLESNYNLRSLQAVNEGRLAALWLKDKMEESRFVRGFYRALSGPARLAGFELKTDPDGIIVLDSDVKKEVKNPRNSLFNSVKDIMKALNIKSTKGDFRDTEQTRKNWWFSKNFNKLDEQGKKDYLQKLYNEGQLDKEIMLEAMELLREGYANGDISLTGVQMLWVGQFADMTGVGKAAGAPRMIPVIPMPDGTFKIATDADLVKAGLAYSKDPYVLEHMIPAKEIATLSLQYILSGDAQIKKELLKKLENYDTSILPKKLDDKLKKERGTQEMMGIDFKTGDSPVDTRYDGLGIMFYDAKTDTFVGSPIKYSKPELTKVKTDQKAIENGRSISWSKSPKKIRVFDFDDTLARTKSNVLYTMPDGTKGKIDAATFAKDAVKMEAEGAIFDFSEFSKVMDGKKGPLFEVAKKIADARGTEDVFVLTARPQDAAGPIQEFLKSLGLSIPLKNITGLGDGNAKAKADWMIGKVAEGYNDFYFADDAIKNVKAVKDVFDTFDIKGKVQQAKVKFSKGLDKGFNDMIERQTGTESFKEFSKGVAQRRGKKVGKFKIFVSPSAEDFRGLTQYKFAGKGKQGEADQKFFEEALMDPYFKGVAAVEAARETIKNDTKALFKIFKPVKKKLNKLVPGIDFTYDGAVRVYLWNKAGIEIPGLTKRDNKKLNDAIANDPELSAFADALLLVSKQDAWPAPTEYWEAKTTLSDLNTLTEKTNRKEYLTEFIENVDIIFSEKNLNKVEALYGKASRVAIENAIYAMKTGSNSPNQSGDGITNRWLNWVNNSIGTIMFFNRRSALLQLTSATNFLNWSDNNPAKAALAFANQPQYWKDWVMIFNSDKLKQRRSGLKSDVQESEIANAAKNTEDKIGSIIAYLLKIGFAPTQIADSIAISSGGATFYRNRVNTYKKQGLDVKEAETKAFEDMSKLSDVAQQSGDPALVSQQQRSIAGRLILSFQNTTMQYTRLMKKSGQDLINRRGDDKTNISKILYYGALMNFIFNALSQTAFALIPGFDEEEEEDKVKRDEKLEEKASRVLNGMADSIIRGTGIYGAIVTTIKNTYNTWKREADKGFKGDQAKTLLEAANVSPAIGSKLRKIYSAIQAYQFDKAVMEKHPWSVTIDGKFNPSATYSVIGNVASATLNLPLDRALAEARGVAEMFDNRNSEMQRIALALGWRTWNVGAKNEEFDLIKMEAKQAKKDKKAKEKQDYKDYLQRVFDKLSYEQTQEYFTNKGAAAKKEWILKIGKEKGIK